MTRRKSSRPAKFSSSAIVLPLRHYDMEVTLADLPNELLFDIFSYLSPQDHFRLGLVCKRLNEVAPILFLASRGNFVPTSFTAICIPRWTPGDSPSPDTMAGISTSFSITSVRHLRCYFQNPPHNPNPPTIIHIPNPPTVVHIPSTTFNPHQEATDLPLALRRLDRFVQRMQSVETVELALVWEKSCILWTHLTTDSGLRLLERMQQDIRDWASTVTRLLDSLLEKGCKRLTLEGNAALLHWNKFIDLESPMERKKPSIIKKTFTLSRRNTQSNLLRSAPQVQWVWNIPKLDTLDGPYILPAGLPRSAPGLSKLSIHSDLLLLPPLTNWTLSVLFSHTNLTSLSLDHISFSRELWGYLLPLIAEAVCGRLTELEVLSGCSYLDAVDLLPFLETQPHLTKLTVNSNIEDLFKTIRPSESIPMTSFLTSTTPILSTLKPSQLFLPDLCTLEAHLEFVTLLLDVKSQLTDTAFTHRRKNSSLSQLKSITVFSTGGPGFDFTMDYARTALAVNELHRRVLYLRGRNFAPIPVSSVEFGLKTWVEFLHSPTLNKFLERLTRRKEHQSTPWNRFNTSEIEKVAASTPNPLIQGAQSLALNYVTHLVVQNFALTVPWREKWPGLWYPINLLFPSLQCLQLHLVMGTGEEQWWMEPDRKPSNLEQGEIERLMQSLKEMCPNVKKLIVGSWTYSL